MQRLSEKRETEREVILRGGTINVEIRTDEENDEGPRRNANVQSDYRFFFLIIFKSSRNVTKIMSLFHVQVQTQGFV